MARHRAEESHGELVEETNQEEVPSLNVAILSQARRNGVCSRSMPVKGFTARDVYVGLQAAPAEDGPPPVCV